MTESEQEVYLQFRRRLHDSPDRFRNRVWFDRSVGLIDLN